MREGYETEKEFHELKAILTEMLDILRELNEGMNKILGGNDDRA